MKTLIASHANFVPTFGIKMVTMLRGTEVASVQCTTEQMINIEACFIEVEATNAEKTDILFSDPLPEQLKSFAGVPFFVNDFMPKDEIWFLDSKKNIVGKIIGLAVPTCKS